MKRISRIGLGLFMIVATILYKPTIMRAIDNSPPNGDIERAVIDKVRDDGHEGFYEITLTVEGFEDTATSVDPIDVMLVLDRSGSMQGDKIAALETHAKDFIHDLFEDNPLSRVAIVSFAGSQYQASNYWTLESDFLDATGQETLNDKIEGLNASGGTHLEGGIYQAHQAMINDLGPNKKFMIVMADGEPTYGFDWTGDRYDFNFDYDKRVGTGSSRLFTKSGVEYNLEDSVAVMANRVKNNTDPAKRFNIYAIGLGINEESFAEAVLQSVGHDGYWQASTENLGIVFNKIRQQMSSTTPGGWDPVVTDKLGAEFEWVDFSAGYPVAPQTASYDDETRIITWNLGDILVDKTYTLKYKVRIHDGLDGGIYPTNEYAVLDYIDINEVSHKLEFPVPEVPVPYRVFVEASPSEGGVVTGAGQYVPGVQVQIDATANAGFMFMGWKRVGSDETIYTEEHGFIMPEADQRWIAYFEPVEEIGGFYFTFDPNHGEEGNVIEGFEAGGSVTPPSFVREGYEFTGWSLDEFGETPYNKFDELPAHDMYVYAQWKADAVEEKPKVYNLTYVTNQPSINYDDVSFEAGDAITPPIPILEGYEFLGWYVDDEFSAEFAEFASMPARDVIVYADWGEVLGDEDEIEVPEMGDIDIQYYGSMLVLIGLLALIISKKDKTIKR